MPLDTRFDDKKGILWIVLEGEIDFVAVMHTVRDLYGADVYRRRIWDIRKTTNHISPEELRELGAAVSRLAQDRSIRSALLTTTDLQFGMSRALKPRVDSNTIALGVFKKEEDAVAWVTSDPDQNSPPNG